MKTLLKNGNSDNWDRSLVQRNVDLVTDGRADCNKHRHQLTEVDLMILIAREA